MKKYNIGILAHVDAGKTSLTEQMLFCAGAIRKAGSVDNGTSATDKLDIERQRGISVKTECACAAINNNKICFIDTPGHVDFAGEVERSLSVLDGAILLISAAEGIQAQTKILFEVLKKAGIPAIIVINKIDRVGCNPLSVVENIKKKLTEDIFISEEAENFGTDECIVKVLPDNALLENGIVALNDESLLESYLSGVSVSRENVFNRIANKTKESLLYPVLFSSAKYNIGIKEILDSIVSFLPDSSYLDEKQLSGIVFKVEHSKDMGKAAFVRLFGGKIFCRDEVKINDCFTCKVTQIKTENNTKYIDSGFIEAGDTGIIYGLSDVKNGDYIGTKAKRFIPAFTVPLMTVTVSTKNDEEKTKLSLALQQLSDEDPMLNYEQNNLTNEMYLSITGKIQLEILHELIKSRYNLDADFSEPNVIFKEKPRIAAVGYESYTMPKPCWAQVELKVEPMPEGSGIKFKSVASPRDIPYRYQHHVEQSVLTECIKQGIYGWNVTDAQITLVSGGYHSIHTHPLDFFVATPVAFLRAMQKSGSIQLEPYVRVTMNASQSILGNVINSIVTMRGTFEPPDIQKDSFTIIAELPVQSSLDFPTEFRSMSAGKGTYTSEFIGYRECPEELYKTLPRRGADPLDRAKWILYCRSALDVDN